MLYNKIGVVIFIDEKIDLEGLNNSLQASQTIGDYLCRAQARMLYAEET